MVTLATRAGDAFARRRVWLAMVGAWPEIVTTTAESTVVTCLISFRSQRAPPRWSTTVVECTLFDVQLQMRSVDRFVGTQLKAARACIGPISF